VALPFVFITVSAGLAQIDQSLEMAAQSIGAPPFRVLMTVTFPVLRTSITIAALFAFLTSFDEISIAFFISSGATRHFRDACSAHYAIVPIQQSLPSRHR
jgi:putative spermidine/putrescine transport system permease protein